MADNSTDAPDPPPQQSGMMDYLKSRPMDTCLWTLRILTVVFGFLYAVPLMGAESQASYYSKTLLAGAATNALRLHQRMGGFRFSREFLTNMMLEDACHYLFYCILFLGSTAATMILLPVFLFAVLHGNNFNVQLLDAIGRSDSGLRAKCKSFSDAYAGSLLNVIACTEIFLFPVVIVMTFSGRASLFIPFIYYRFISLRYMSRRNPNTRYAFYQLRVALEQAVARPQCPQVLRNGAHKMIGLVARCAPQSPPAQ